MIYIPYMPPLASDPPMPPPAEPPPGIPPWPRFLPVAILLRGFTLAPENTK